MLITNCTAFKVQEREEKKIIPNDCQVYKLYLFNQEVKLRLFLTVCPVVFFFPAEYRLEGVD